MPQSPTTFLEEAKDAAHGVYALLTGDRAAARFFDLTLGGLVGSFAMVLIAVTLASFAPLPFDVESAAPPTPTLDIILSLMAYGIQAGAAYGFFNLIGRLDGFIPYLVASNWVTFFSAIALQVAFAVVGMGIAIPGLILLLAILIGSLILFVNVARFIATLKPSQIVMLLVVDGIALFIGLALLSVFIPTPVAS
ncbi:hypothetical protein PSQ90_04680 [Devosia rhodophyticola]|uniref:Yip1 domain-containing protein n=1 Tax=Devosia rhodophyticola TaxID=3026423 RepID=A0ABY7YZS7_9HYPH|nr:hypothetical protein [Devosia rhodophyticola]WDR06752.1 hypothetical protein PSQ90_04680 [Devosia rhodophyticola]